MKNSLLVILILAGISSNAQAPVDDDMPDTRNKRESFARLPKDDVRADIATFAMGGIDESIGKAPLKKILITNTAANTMTFEGESIKVFVTTIPFDEKKHKLDYDEKYLIKIDKRTYYGGYPKLPKTQVTNISLVMGKDTIAIPPAAYTDLFNLNLTYKDKTGKERSTNGIYLSKMDNRVYIYLFSKDESGSYEVTFVIHARKYVRRVLDYDFM